MAKSIGNRILTAIAAICVSLCLVLSVSALSGVRAYADEPPAYVTEFDSSHTYTEGDVKQALDYVYGEVRELYAQLEGKSNVIDNYKYADGKYASAESEIEELSTFDEFAATLFGDAGLNGIRIIAGKAVEFYDYYVDPDGEFAAKRSEYTSANWKNITSDIQKHYAGFNLDNFAPSFSGAAGIEYYDSFAEKLAAYDGKEQEVTEYIQSRKDEVQKIYDQYHTEKYDLGDMEKYVTSEDLDKALADIDLCDGKEDANRVASEFISRFTGVPTYMELRAAEITASEESVRKMPNDNSAQAAAKDGAYGQVLADCQSALDYYTALDRAYHDLKDNTAASNILTLYKKAIKDDVTVKSRLHNGDYGISAEKAISTNKQLASQLADALGTEGKLPADKRYSYVVSDTAALQSLANTTKNVETGSSVAEAFEDSYSVAGALRSDGEQSTVPSIKSSTVTYNGDDFNITITAVTSDKTSEVRDFDSEAKLQVRDGTSPSVKRNINVMLGKDGIADRMAADIADKDKIASQLKGKQVHHYLTITVLEGEIVRENFDEYYKVSIEFLKDDGVAQYKDKINVINYYHLEITGACAEEEITMEGNVMEFYTGNFSQFAIVDGINMPDWALIALIGVIALVVLVVLIAVIILLIKNRKYAVVFNANGGRSTKTIRVKHNEKFSYPKNPVRKGYVFMGWYTSKDCVLRFASTEMIDKRRVVVYAKWITEEEYAALNAEEAKEETVEQPVEKPAEPVAAVVVNEEANRELEERVTKLEEEMAENQRRLKEQEEKAAEAEAARKAAEEEAENAKRRAEEADAEIARLTAVAAESEEEEPVEEPAVEEEQEEEEAQFDVNKVFDELKSEIYSYENANDLPYGIDEVAPACAMKVVNGAIELEVNLDLAEMQAKGYNVTEGEKLPTKFCVSGEENVAEAEELIEETMYANGLKKTEKAVITESSDETRENGFEYGYAYERKAETPEEFYKLIRVYARSYVLAEEAEVEEKNLIKMFLDGNAVFMYINYAVEGGNECDEALKAEGYQSFVVVRDADECKAAIGYIAAMMKQNGLIRFPVDVAVAEDASDKGFTYTLKK